MPTIFFFQNQKKNHLFEIDAQCAQGRAAWLERGRRCSVQEREAQVQAASAHRRWVKRNRVSTSFGSIQQLNSCTSSM